MKNFSNQLRIPTLLGVSIIIIGIIVGVWLVIREQSFISQASPDVTAKEITLTNVSDTEATISYQTSAPAASFITLGQTNPDEQTILDDRDTNLPAGRPQSHLMHYFTIKNLLPKTNYQYKIISGKNIKTDVFTTAAPLTFQTGFRPIIGSVIDKDHPLEEGIVYLSVASAIPQSAQVKSGNFLVPISQIRKADLSDGFPLSGDTIVKITVVSPNGQANALFKLSTADKSLPPVKLGENLDLTTITPQPSPQNQDFKTFDLNSDGKINAADNSIILQNFGKNPKNKKADLNSDGKVDQKDLDLMAKQINQ